MKPLTLSQSRQTTEVEALVGSRPVSERRPFGAYYTPRTVTDTLAQWAIRDAGEVILEPGFGGCGFLEASQTRIEALGADDPFANIYGCDKDPGAFAILGHKIGDNTHTERFILGDFLCLRPENFKVSGFDVVIGNPPYVSLHSMSPQQRAAAVGAMTLGRFKLDKRASLWAYFVLHALTFLRQGGRCAWVLPSSYLHAEYARDIRLQLKKKFTRLVEITLEQRLFSSEGAKERTVVVLAEGFESCTGEARIQRLHATDAAELEVAVTSLANSNPTAISSESFLSPLTAAMSLLDGVRSKQACRKLGEFLDVKIGIVTGANDFFIKNAADWKEHGIAENALRPILAKFSQVSGLELSLKDLSENRANGLKCLLLDGNNKGQMAEEVDRYLAGFPDEKKEKNATFKKRSNWYSPDDGRTPDGFFSYMCDHGPRLALNPAKTTSTNTIHRIYFNDDIDEIRRKAIAMSMLSTVTQLSAELVGRSYGSGVLKLEPSEVRQIDIVLPDVLDAKRVIASFDAVDMLLREGEGQKARGVVDTLFIIPLLGKAGIASMEAALTRLRSIRREPRTNK